MIRIGCTLLLLLGGCMARISLSPSPAPSLAPSPAEQACADQADNDPAVKEQRAIAAGKLDWQWKHEDLMRQVRQDAITRCLRARGLAPKGGVERPI